MRNGRRVGGSQWVAILVGKDEIGVRMRVGLEKGLAALCRCGDIGGCSCASAAIGSWS